MLAHEKMEYQQAIRQNQHEIYVVSFEEMDMVIKSLPAIHRKKAQTTWESIRGTANAGATYYSTATDAVKLNKLVTDLGGLKAKVYVKNYGGKPHIIIKGHPGLRKILTGTKYGIKHPKVISLGLGRHAAIGAAKSGGLISVVLMTGYRVADYVLTDEATLFQLVGSLATDIVKIGIAVGASVAAVAAVGLITTAAIGPLVAVVIISIGTAWLLQSIDSRFEITKRVIAGLEEMGLDADTYIAQRRLQIIRGFGHAARSAIDRTVESAKHATIHLVRDAVRRSLNSRPKL